MADAPRQTIHETYRDKPRGVLVIDRVSRHLPGIYVVSEADAATTTSAAPAQGKVGAAEAIRWLPDLGHVATRIDCWRGGCGRAGQYPLAWSVGVVVSYSKVVAQRDRRRADAMSSFPG